MSVPSPVHRPHSQASPFPNQELHLRRKEEALGGSNGGEVPRRPRAANDFGRRSLQPWEARMVHDAGYMSLSDFRCPPTWKLSTGGMSVPPVPQDDEMVQEIQAAIAVMEDPELIEDPGNLVYWENFFAEHQNRELAAHDDPPGTPPKRHNMAARRRWWSAPGRTLTAVLEHIIAGNRPRLGFPPHSPSSAAHHRPAANWLPSLSSSSFATSASRSFGSVLALSPRATGEATRTPSLQPVKREAEPPVRSSSRMRSRGIVINEGRVPSRTPKLEPTDWAVLVDEDIFVMKMAMENSLNDVLPMQAPDAYAWSRAD